MPVFDFSDTPNEKKDPECTYEVFYSNESEATPEKPILILDNSARQWKHHSGGIFTNPSKRTTFEFKEEDNWDWNHVPNDTKNEGLPPRNT